jgi:hypothetical protein
MKTCFKCGKSKELSEFYKHTQMADGYFSKCKSCTKLDILRNRYKKIDYYKDYDRKRAMLHHRVEAREIYGATERGKIKKRLCAARWIEKNPEKRKEVVKKWNAKNKKKRNAQQALRVAVKTGKIIKMPCIMCGNKKSQGHHKDYDKRLEVDWLCAECHGKEHAKIRKQ